MSPTRRPRNKRFDPRLRLQQEVGRIDRRHPNTIALVSASTYHPAMSSLGMQTVYRLIQTSNEFACERAFAPDTEYDEGLEGPADTTYESQTPVGSFPVVAFSIAYELELAELLKILHRAGIEVIASKRPDDTALVLAGGPLTMSNPDLLKPFADAVIVGEAEPVLLDVLRASFHSSKRTERLRALAQIPGVWVPQVHSSPCPAPIVADRSNLPAWAPIRTPNTELRDMFLIEAVRGCARRCDYCVMRGTPGRTMRIVDQQALLQLIPQDARRVGLVGASVSDHPNLTEILHQLADQDKSVGVSSLRPERLTVDLVRALRRTGYKTMTTAMDGASDALRARIHRNTTAQHILDCTATCRQEKIERLKLYLMVGLPGETEDDIRECADLVREVSRLLPVSLGVAPFCPKKGTPLADAVFAGTDLVDAHIALLRSELKGRADIRAVSSRWAWVEAVLSKGSDNEAVAVWNAVQQGGSFSDYRNELRKLGHSPRTDRPR